MYHTDFIGTPLSPSVTDTWTHHKSPKGGQRWVPDVKKDRTTRWTPRVVSSSTRVDNGDRSLRGMYRHGNELEDKGRSRNGRAVKTQRISRRPVDLRERLRHVHISRWRPRPFTPITLESRKIRGRSCKKKGVTKSYCSRLKPER